MANTFMPKGKQYVLTNGLSGKTLKVVLVDTGAYTFSSSHEFLSDVASGARIATSPALTSITFASGVLDSADATDVAVSGASVEGAYLYVDTGTPATSNLIAWYDTATGLPFTPNGGDVNNIVSASGWLSL